MGAAQTPLHSAPAALPSPQSPQRTANQRRRPPPLQFAQDELALPGYGEPARPARRVTLDGAAPTGPAEEDELNAEVCYRTRALCYC